MLSRIAESLFWIGRYIERADGTARILDVHLQLLLEDPWIDEDTACRSLLSVMGALPNEERPLERKDVMYILGLDRTNPGSIAHSIVSARENARRAREIVSSELWEVLNQTRANMPWSVDLRKTSDFFQWVRERSTLAMGIIDASSTRDEAWLFFTLGRAIERADMTARLLATSQLTEASGPSWTTILRSCGAYEAYLRTYGGLPSTLNAAEFLILDQLFPRSIMFSVTQAIECLEQIEATTGNTVADSARTTRARLRGLATHKDEALRVLGMVRSDLEFRALPDTLDELPKYMEGVQAATSKASTAIAGRYFPTDIAPSWTGEAS